MKISKEKEKFKQMSKQDLQKKIELLQRELFNVRLNSSTTHVKDYSQFKKLRRSIARVKTYTQQVLAEEQNVTHKQ